MREIVIGRIPDDFSSDRHVALGPWCFFSAEGICRGWDELPFVDAFPRAADRSAADAATRGLMNQLLDELWPAMNRRHNVNHSRAYWHTILVSWLLHVVQMSWRFYAHIRCFVASHGGEPFTVPVHKISGRFRFADSARFVDACFGDSEFRAWLIGRIVQVMAPPTWTLRVVAAAAPAAADVRPFPRRACTHLPVDHVYGMNRWRWLMSGWVHVLPRRKPRPASPPPPVPRGYFPADYITLVNEVIEKSMPDTLDGGFATLESRAARVSYAAGRLRITTIDPNDDANNIVLGNAIDAGERVVPAQHGGTYGWGDALSISAECDYAHDSFLSWGWTQQQGYAGRFVPFPSPLLSRNLDRHTGANGDVVMIGHAMRAFNPRLDFVPCSLEYRRRKKRFIDALAPDVVRHLRYRPYNMAETFEDDIWLKRTHPTIPIIKGALDQAMLASKLVVLDHPGTMLAVALSANIPTIAFWDRDLWPLAAQAKPLFDQLEQAGILFGDPEPAAAQLNAVWPRVRDWWHEPRRQEVRRAWCHVFARTSRHWQFDWLKNLPSL